MPLAPSLLQESGRIALEWGLSAVDLVGPPTPRHIAVVVDVLSFTTTVTVALDRGLVVEPAVWDRSTATDRHAQQDRPSLSPAHMATYTGTRRVVLPSPNGATICAALADRGTTVVAACLRNATAAGTWLAAQPDARILVIPAGERWPDGTLRPALEDLLGAGLVLRGLPREQLSAEARFAADAAGAIPPLADLGSGRELIERGFADDVTIAAEQDVSSVVPVLTDGVFAPAEPLV